MPHHSNFNKEVIDSFTKFNFKITPKTPRIHWASFAHELQQARKFPKTVAKTGTSSKYVALVNRQGAKMKAR